MNINKFLCKWFDYTGKGYVTVGNFGFGLIFLSVFFVVIRYIAYGTYYLINMLYYNNGDSYSNAQQLSIIVAGVIIGLIWIGIIGYVSFIKIAECPLRTEETEDTKQ